MESFSNIHSNTPIPRKSDIKYAADIPYPPVSVEEPNPEYAREILDNVGGSISEMTAVSLYFYDHIMTSAYKNVALAFHKISIVEMHHLEIFSNIALQLGENPRLWTQNKNRRAYWTPGYLDYATDIQHILLNAIKSEQAAIAKYERQMKTIHDRNIKDNLQRILIDEDLHVQILRDLFHNTY